VSSEKEKKERKESCGTYYYLDKWGIWMLHDRLDPCESDEDKEE